MKQILEKCLSQYKALHTFIKSERWTNTTNGFCIVFYTLVLFSLLCLLFPKRRILWFGCICFVIISIMFILLFEHKSRMLWVLTKKRFKSAAELFTQFTHMSFLYGLFFFSTSISVWVCFIFCVIELFVFNSLSFFVVYHFYEVFIIVAFAFSFLYFCYHLYYNPAGVSTEDLKLRVQHYAAILATTSFLLLCIGFEATFKLFFSGLTIVFYWLQYLFEKQIQHQTQSN